MYSVTKRIEFCYGHRLMDYDGICKHPHGHNAVAEIEITSGTLDGRNMVCDFSDIKRIVKGWVDRELDHKMILREDDPLVAPAAEAGRAGVRRVEQSDGGAYREVIVRLYRVAGLPGRAGDGVGNAHVVRDVFRRDDRALTLRHVERQRLVVFDLDGTLIDSRRDLADSANEMLTEYGAAPLTEDAIGRMVGAGAAQLVARALEAARVDVPLENALARFLISYDRRLTNHTRPYPGIPEVLNELASEQVKMALLTNKPLDASSRILETFGLSRFFRLRVGGDGPWPRKPAPEGLQFLIKGGIRPAVDHGAGGRFRRRSGDSTQCRRAHLPGALRIRVRRSRA